MKSLLVGISTAALLASGAAIAQTTTPDTTTKAPVETQKPMNDRTPATTPTAPVTPRASAPTMHPDQFAGAYRASKLIGTKVMSAGDKNIGDINDLMVTKDGQVDKIIVGVGGFLGLGERNVAFKFNDLQLVRDANNKLVVKSSMTADALKAMPEWKPHDEAGTAMTGAGGGTRN
jgi:PRC-barrel domain